MKQETIEKIVNDGVRAPSGDNSQPWRFVFENDSLYIFNIPNRDNPIFNYKQRGSYIAHGALIENIILSSLAQGFEARVSLFPNKHDINCVAVITFQQTVQMADPLYAQIPLRATNRKPYANTPFTEEEQKKL